MTDHSPAPRIEGLVDLACRSGVDVRPTLLRVLTDLYVQARSHSSSEEAQYVELALRLIDSVDDQTRAAVAARLAGYPRAPLAVLRRLDEMADAQSEGTAEPADNDLSAAFFAADSYERRLILTNLDAADSAAVRRSASPATETCRRLEAAVLEHRLDEFARRLESALLLPRGLAGKIAADQSGEPVVVAAKALGMPNAALQRILLLINPAIGRSVARVYELSALYDEISVHAAEAMVDIWRGASRRRPAHQTALWDDEQRSARAATTTARYHTNRRSDAAAARFRNSGR
jgi:hypothetical protein